MYTVEEARATRVSNNDAMEKQREEKHRKAEMVKQGWLEKATDGFIHNLIYRKMWDLDRHWKIAEGVGKGVRGLKLKKDREAGLKDNAQIHYKELGWVEAKTTWLKNGRKKTMPQLQGRLIEIIKLTEKMASPRSISNLSVPADRNDGGWDIVK